MIVEDPGHKYLLHSLDGGQPIPLTFVKREGPLYPGNIGSHPGTTTQEVLRACIARAFYVNWQIPCWQTRLSIPLMKFVIWLYEHRAAKRHNRKIPTLNQSVYDPICKGCGHVGCREEL